MFFWREKRVGKNAETWHSEGNFYKPLMKCSRITRNDIKQSKKVITKKDQEKVVKTRVTRVVA